jgi:hypothetical protein
MTKGSLEVYTLLLQSNATLLARKEWIEVVGRSKLETFPAEKGAQ